MLHDSSLLIDAPAALDPMLLEHEFSLLGYGRGSAPPSPEALLAEGFGARIDDPLETTFVLRTSLADSSLGAPAHRAFRGFTQLVMPMIVAVEALMARRLAPAEIAGMRHEALALADDAAAGLGEMPWHQGGTGGP